MEGYYRHFLSAIPGLKKQPTVGEVREAGLRRGESIEGCKFEQQEG
jgi:hypothetical protein